MKKFSVYFSMAMFGICLLNNSYSHNTSNTSHHEALYNAIEVDELNVNYRDQDGFPIIGSTTFEKSSSGVLCQKKGAVVPNPIFNFTCYIKVNGISASETYFELSEEELSVNHSDSEGNPLVGSDITEKSSVHVLCRKYTPVFPGAESSFKCYSKLNL